MYHVRPFWYEPSFIMRLSVRTMYGDLNCTNSSPLNAAAWHGTPTDNAFLVASRLLSVISSALCDGATTCVVAGRCGWQLTTATRAASEMGRMRSHSEAHFSSHAQNSGCEAQGSGYTHRVRQ